MRGLAPLALAALALSGALAGCAEGPRQAALIPYPRLGDVATYEIEGAYVEFARWENGHPLPAGTARVRFGVTPGAAVFDGARAVHDVFVVAVQQDDGGGFVRHAEHHVSPKHQGLVQSYYKLSQDQGIVAFDERGFPWLFGASALFGQPLGEDAPLALPDNLGRGVALAPRWRAAGTEPVGDVVATRYDLDGAPGMEGSVWMTADTAWPLRARLAIVSPDLAPHVRVDAALPAHMEARRMDVTEGGEPVPPRDRGETFGADRDATRETWDGEKPPDGQGTDLAYRLSEAVRDAKLLDRGLQAWLQEARDPRVYRATYQVETGPAEGTRQPLWLVQFVDAEGRYYEVQVQQARLDALAVGAPRVTSSGPATPPEDPNHGWFAADAAPADLVPLADAVRIMKTLFGAADVQIFLRSFTDPAGYSYFIDGGFEREGGRYTVVYNPATAFVEEATGPVSIRYADP